MWNVLCFIKGAIYSRCQIFIPSIRVRARPFPKWFSSDIVHDCKRLRKMKRSCNSATKLHKIQALEESRNPGLNPLLCQVQSSQESAPRFSNTFVISLLLMASPLQCLLTLLLPVLTTKRLPYSTNFLFCFST